MEYNITVSSENKYSYFVFTVAAVKGSTLPGEQTMVSVISQLTDKYLFQLEKATSLHYQGCCKLRIRKRIQTFANELIAALDVPKESVTVKPMQGTWEQAKAYCSKADTSVSEPFTNEVTYSGKDIEVLDTPEGRYSWQDSIIKKIIDESSSTIKDADDRQIIWIEDIEGGTGKSKLVKWACCRYDSIIKISFGTSNQLRSAIISAGPRSAYFIDVPRTLGSDDSMPSLMSTIEDLKNGFVVSAMYGKQQQLVLDPPHIICFSNMECPIKYLTKDRWDIYIINKDKELISYKDKYKYPWN